MTGCGTLGRKIEQQGVSVNCLELTHPGQLPAAVASFRGWLRERRAAVVQSWMYKADLLASCAMSRSGPPLVWNVRQTNIDYRFNSLGTLAAIGWLRGISRGYLPGRAPAKIVYCAEAARRSHQRRGYPSAPGVVIPNGIPITELSRNPGARARLRRELGIIEEAPVVGMVGRYDPQKGHRRFLECAAQIRRRVADVRFVLVGRGISPDNRELAKLLRRFDLESVVTMLGQRQDVAELMSVFDVYLSSSDGEGWPNVLAEAMACEVACVATDVGDTAALMGDLAYVHSPEDREGLAASAVELLLMPAESRRNIGVAARERIASCFSLGNSVARYEDLYASVIGDRQCAE